MDSVHPRTRILLLGLPLSGKTTYLAALWYLAERGEVPDALQLAEMQPDREYLVRIARAWAAVKAIERTSIATTELVRMELREPGTDRITEVVFPDLSGETFREQWKNRWWTREFEDLATSSTSVMLFVHPDKIRYPKRIDDEARQLAALIPGTPTPDESQLPNALTEVRNTDRVPTQVVLVELLQFLEFDVRIRKPLPTAVIVSAWDRVLDETTPDGWLSANLPLLQQFLAAKHATFPSRVFGISAQGGDLAADTNELRRHFRRPSDRVSVIEGDERSHDLTRPIKWLLASG